MPTIAPASYAPDCNLEGMTDTELQAYNDACADSPDANVRIKAQMACNIVAARQKRRAGWIDQATRIEAQVDRNYDRLDGAYQW